ncbi:DUF4185 domain-containing protein [Pseudoflavitalea sp. G-6-1-2]|uniref:DUF4185 domain-containing protein n=1 Tax=Pseudoflavitalea sp. G-6-1-2 TaxID=2728841 RepID=UPI00146CEAAD|nr:DUF4185 domain-containing protein [Pseudoflavitalea sp. G-6-1-2]NML21719.1 DUF4185 domain-containing protein [Pseudoflavitalea sp. G-6-1-2]
MPQSIARHTVRAVSFAFASLLMAACSNSAQQPPEEKKKPSLDSLNFTATEAPEWSNLFKRTSGWFGGDGIFAVTRNGRENPGSSAGSETVIWFSDTMLGEIEKDSLKPGYEMIHNSVAVLKGSEPKDDRINFQWKKEDGKNLSLFKPTTPATAAGDYYWLGDGFVNQSKNNDLYIFGYRIKDIAGGGAFGFKEVGNTLVVIPAASKAPFADQRQLDIPFFLGKDVDSAGSFGAGIYVNTKEAGATDPDGFVYIYGVRGKTKALMIARVQPASIEDFSQWNFWDGKDWTSDVSRIATVTDKLSNELGMMRLRDGRYALVFQEEGLGKYVALRLADSPVGPFGKVIRLFDCSASVAEDKDFFPYNAKVHPVLSTPDELLISYNVNSFDFFTDVKKYPQLYRPRFVRVKINE